jgi:ABC-type nitrate/sulfonate/bicarbonate transport system permease component
VTRRIPDRALPWLTVAAALGLGELVTRTGLVDPADVPPPTQVIDTLVSRLGTSELWHQIGDTLTAWALALAIAAALAVPLGILVGSSRLLYRALRVPIEFLRPIPSVALIPLAVLLYGNGLRSQVFLAVFACFWILLVQMLYGVRDVDPVATETARAFRVGRGARLVRVTLPGASPYLATGLRLACSASLVIVVTAELVIGTPGLGKAINVARFSGNVELTYALVLVTGLLGFGLNALFAALERRVLHWHPAQRRAVPA